MLCFLLSGCGGQTYESAGSGAAPIIHQRQVAASSVASRRVQIGDLARQFPLPRLDEASIIRGPRELAYIHQIRQRVQGRIDFGASVASDVILWAPGEPPQPYHTKFGGAPYRPESSPWPTIGGKRLTFIAQWYFADSAWNDDLPGDVLLMFADCSKVRNEYWIPDPEEVCFEWSQLGIEKVSQTTVVQSRYFPAAPLHAVLCRFDEFPDRWYQASEELTSFGVEDQSYLAITTQASRIGGTTWYIQGDGPPPGSKLLCTLSAIWPEPNVADPFLDVLAPLSEEDAENYAMMLGDVGCIYVFINSEGKLNWEVDCY